MCDRGHRYTIEVIGQVPRYIGTDTGEAVSALLGIDIDNGEEGYVVAEHDEGDRTSYCRPGSQLVEGEALAVGGDDW
jgi:hypothetical protein